MKFLLIKKRRINANLRMPKPGIEPGAFISNTLPTVLYRLVIINLLNYYQVILECLLI